MVFIQCDFTVASSIISWAADSLSGFFSNRGMNLISGEYYRYASGLFLHQDLLHIFANASVMYWLGRYLEPQIDPSKLLLFSLSLGTITNILFSFLYPQAQSVGGSPLVYALLGLIVALQIMDADIFTFQFGTWYGNWIISYVILSNMLHRSDNVGAAWVIHGTAVLLGILFGCVCLKWKLF